MPSSCSTPSALCPACATRATRTTARTRDASLGVLCSDGDSVRHRDAAQLRASSVTGAFWASIRMPCSAWPFRPAWNFKGPFTTPEPGRCPARDPEAGRPAAPPLFLSNRLDPVTPLRAARAMAVNHPGARLVIQEGLGHCVLFSANSSCVARIVAEYFDSVELPSSDTTCSVDCGPWDPACAGAASLSNDHLNQYASRAQSASPLGLVFA